MEGSSACRAAAYRSPRGVRKGPARWREGEPTWAHGVPGPAGLAGEMEEKGGLVSQAGREDAGQPALRGSGFSCPPPAAAAEWAS